MKQLLILVLLACCALPATAGTKEDIEQVQRNLLELQQQFWNLEKELKTNSSSFQDNSQKLQSMAEDLRNNQAALNAKLETILNQLQALNEGLEETNRRVKDLTTNRVVNPSAGVDSGNPMTSQNPGMDAAAPAQGTVGEQQIFQAARAEYSKGNFEQAL